MPAPCRSVTGKTLTTPDENIAELRARLAAFTAGPLPVLQQLGIA